MSNDARKTRACAALTSLLKKMKSYIIHIYMHRHLIDNYSPTILFWQFSAEFFKLVPECKVCSSDYFLYFGIILGLFPYNPGKLRVKIPE